MSKYNLRRACAVISGASSGLGLEIAKILCGKYGCKVIGLARGHKKLEKAAETIGDNFVPFVCDITSKEDRERLLDFIKDNGFKPDILRNFL